MVAYIKDKMSYSAREKCPRDFASRPVTIVRIMRAVADKTYGRNLGRRLQVAREAHGATREQLAKMLSIEIERYKKWETRGPVPTRFIAPICDILDCDIYWLLTGVRKTQQGSKVKFFARFIPVAIPLSIIAAQYSHIVLSL